jgi:hypothetical protein
MVEVASDSLLKSFTQDLTALKKKEFSKKIFMN